MISQETRMWLLSMVTMSVVSWAATISSLLVLIDLDRLTGYAAALLLVWIGVVSVPVTFQTVSCWRRVRAARRVHALGHKHARLFEILSGEITSLR
ncbi:hypothetical protein ACFV0L_18795 [Streptosporangium canum]|uniref:hypothetical protein n=1 Tax=Streptosporangium canum TaxID=324952 RepID=UPI0036A9D1AD